MPGDEAMLKFAYTMGVKDSDGNARFIKKLEELVKDIFNDDLTIEEKEMTLHLIGLADNKIDTNPKLTIIKRKLSSEIEMQEVFLKHGQFQNLEESERRCKKLIKEAQRLISPRNIDVGSAADQALGIETKDKTTRRAI